MTPESLVSWLLEASFAASLLVLLVLVLRRPVRRAFGARAAMLLWLAPALRLVCPPLGTGLLPSFTSAGGTAAGEAAPAPLSQAAAPLADTAPVLTAQASGPLPRLADTAALPAPSGTEPFLASIDLALLALGLWLGGAALSFGLALLRTEGWRRTLLREARPASRAVEDLTARCAREVGLHSPHVVLTGAAASPQVTGVVRPLIALPDDFERRFSPNEQRLALLHELTHLRRHDLVQGWAAEAACALHWFNPLMRAALPRMRADQEAACDEAVRACGVGVRDYAGTLLRAARGPAVPALALNHALHERIETMRAPLPKTATRLFGTSALFALAIGVAAAAQTTERPQDEDRAPATDRQEIEESARQEVQDSREAAREIARVKMKEAKRSTYTSSDGTHTIRVGAGSPHIVGGSDAQMVLLSDPFAELTRQQPEAPDGPKARSTPPAPPAPPAPEVRTREDEEGTWILVPDGMDPEFEAEMEAFEQEMEAWEESHSAEMEEWEAQMEAFGEEMGEWGERMGAAGEAIGELADACDDHRDGSDEPAIVTARVEDSGETVKAVCVAGGQSRFASEEVTRFVEENDTLSKEEKAAFFENRRGSGYAFRTED